MASFYKKGLRFTCVQCGQCCLVSSGVVYINEEESQTLAKHLQLNLSQFYQQYTEIEASTGLRILQSLPDGACIFYQNSHCSVYPARPLQCRTYPFWPENLTSAYQWKQTAKECPGIGQGEQIPAQQIEQLRQLQADHDAHLLQQIRSRTK